MFGLFGGDTDSPYYGKERKAKKVEAPKEEKRTRSEKSRDTKAWKKETKRIRESD